MASPFNGGFAAYSLLVFLSFAFFAMTPVTSSSDLAKTANLQAVISSASANLTVPAGHELRQVLFAVGDQIYTFNGSSWELVNAAADLYNFKGCKVGHHYFLTEKDTNGGQPTWETFEPFSRVTVKGIASLPQEGTINWLLTGTTSKRGARKFFGSTTFVQRVYTQHGQRPDADFPAKVGDVFMSPYTSLYNFYSPKHKNVQY